VADALNWGVVQLVGHLTVNEDGEGSNPSAPATLPSENDGLADSNVLLPIALVRKPHKRSVLFYSTVMFVRQFLLGENVSATPN
jgi:hypothetical protein